MKKLIYTIIITALLITYIVVVGLFYCQQLQTALSILIGMTFVFSIGHVWRK